MNNFQKNIFKKSTGIELPPSAPTVSLIGEDNQDCSSQISLRVSTNVQVKVNIFGTFSTGGSWLDIGQLSLSGTKVTGDLTGDIVTFRQNYNFGIYANNVGTITGTSTISLEIRDDITNAVIDTYVFNRSHTLIQC